MKTRETVANDAGRCERGCDGIAGRGLWTFGVRRCMFEVQTRPSNATSNVQLPTSNVKAQELRRACAKCAKVYEVDFEAKAKPQQQLGEFGPLSTPDAPREASAPKSQPRKRLDLSKNLIVAAAWSR
jgi:hypothetical protein